MKNSVKKIAITIASLDWYTVHKTLIQLLLLHMALFTVAMLAKTLFNYCI